MGTGVDFDRSDPESDLLSDLFYPLFAAVFDEEGDFVGDVDRKLTEARMAAPTELYISRSLAVGVLLGVVLWIAGTAVGYGLFWAGLLSPESLSLGIPVSSEAAQTFLRSLVVPATIAVTGIVFGTIGFALGFGSMLAIPYSRADS
ncbi:MAG: type II secretion system F family protein, partial [Halobacteriota archaeon]